jgi:hypothetical protein
VLALHLGEARLLALAVLCVGTRSLFVHALAGIGGAQGSLVLLLHRGTLAGLLLPGLLAAMLLRRQLPLPLRFPFTGLLLLALLVGALLLYACALAILFALPFLHVLLRLLPLPAGALLLLRLLPLLVGALLLRLLPLLVGALLLHALLLGLGCGALARIVGARVWAMRLAGPVIARRRPGRLLRGRMRRMLVLVLVLVLVVPRVLVLLLLGRVARDGRTGDADRQCQADDAGQGVLAQGLHVRPPGRDCDRSYAVGVEGA